MAENGNEFIANYVFKWGDKDPKIVEKYLRATIENPKSSYILGNLYLTGTILPKNLQRADWFITKAANCGYAPAINSIGDGYYSGDIRSKDITKALKCYEKAAKMGFGPAQFNAGIVLFRNAKCKKDLKLAILYLDKASKNRNDLNDMVEVAGRYKLDAENKLRAYQ